MVPILKSITNIFACTKYDYYYCCPIVDGQISNPISKPRNIRIWLSMRKEYYYDKYNKIVQHFESEESEIRNFLISEAKDSGEVKTYLLFWKVYLVGYFSLKETTIADDNGRIYYALQIRALGRDSRYIGCHVGDYIMSYLYAVLTLIRHGDETFFPRKQHYKYLIVNAKFGAVPYYLKYGFTFMENDMVKNSEDVVTLTLPLDIAVDSMIEKKKGNEKYIDIYRVFKKISHNTRDMFKERILFIVKKRRKRKHICQI